MRDEYRTLLGRSKRTPERKSASPGSRRADAYARPFETRAERDQAEAARPACAKPSLAQRRRRRVLKTLRDGIDGSSPARRGARNLMRKVPFDPEAIRSRTAGAGGTDGWRARRRGGKSSSKNAGGARSSNSIQGDWPDLKAWLSRMSSRTSAPIARSMSSPGSFRRRRTLPAKGRVTVPDEGGTRRAVARDGRPGPPGLLLAGLRLAQSPSLLRAMQQCRSRTNSRWRSGHIHDPAPEPPTI